MIVTVIDAGMMQMPPDQIVDVIAVRNALMTTTGPMLVPGVMAGAGMTAAGRFTYFQRALIDMVTVLSVQMIIVNIVNMIAMPYRRMATAIPVLVIVILVCFATHLSLLS